MPCPPLRVPAAPAMPPPPRTSSSPWPRARAIFTPSPARPSTARAAGSTFCCSPQQLSITCPYCGSAYVVRSRQSRELIDPHLILPFTLAENQADQAFSAWLSEQNLAAGAQVERTAAIYLPAWSFEMAGQVPWSCLVEERRNHWVTENGSEIVYHSSVLVRAASSPEPGMRRRHCAPSILNRPCLSMNATWPIGRRKLTRSRWATPRSRRAAGRMSLKSKARASACCARARPDL